MSLKKKLIQELKREITADDEIKIMSEKVYQDLLGKDHRKIRRHWEYLTDNGRVIEVKGDERFQEAQCRILMLLTPSIDEYPDRD